MPPYLLALDQGTSSSRSILFDLDGNLVASASRPLACRYPQPGWVEQDPEEIWQSQWTSVEACLAQANVSWKQVAAMGITNQRETTIVWDKETGLALAPAIVWQDRRTAAHCQALKDQGWEAEFRAKTGLLLDPYFSGTKLAWLLQNQAAVAAAAQAGRLAFGTVDSWLLHRLSGGKLHVTDASNASRTLLYDIHQGAWDLGLCRALGVPLECLPAVRPTAGLFGRSTQGCLITGVAGDQQASLFGQACFQPGEAKNTYGTGCFLLVNTGSQAVASRYGLITTIAWQLGDQVTYALEGSAFMGGATLQWLRDQLGLFTDTAETAAIAESLPHNGGVYLVPAFVGLGAPHWDPHARGIITGLGRETDKRHVVRAGLESIAYQVYELLHAAEADAGMQLQTLKVDGGAAQNPFLCQFQADLLQCAVTRPQVAEATALGAALLAGLGAEIYDGLPRIQSLWRFQQKFNPQMKLPEREKLLQGWKQAVEKAKSRH